MICLGCPKNLVDAEIMLGSLQRRGARVTKDPRAADVLIVNTCSFLDSAQQESVDAILGAAAERETANPAQALVVAGCLPQRFRETLPGLLPEVDAFVGVDQVAEVGAILPQAIERRARCLAERRTGGDAAGEPSGAAARARRPVARARTLAAGRVCIPTRPTYLPDCATPRLRLTPRHAAYLKIAEGCNHPCSFCVIPRVRGRHRSRALADLRQEAVRLLEEGVKELNLISQDSTYYGLDLRPEAGRGIASPARFEAAVRSLPPEAPRLSGLLRELNALEGDFWIRVLYTHPAHWTDELVRAIAECRKVARYVDLPLQHIHPEMLGRMRRETSREHIVDLLQRLRSGIPGITIRTTFIVGFPGETEAMFEDLLQFIQTARFDRLGVFAYSQEEGTAAGRMKSQVPEVVRQRRRDEAMALQRDTARAHAAAQMGRRLKVLVEGTPSAAQVRAARVARRGRGWGCPTSGAPTTVAELQVCVARSEADAPDIDGRVYVLARRSVPAGEFAEVSVVGHTDYDLVAEMWTGGDAGST